MSASSDKEQGSDDNAKQQKARAEENQKETEQLSKLKQQQHWATPSLLGCCNLYIAFVATIATVGGVAYYTNHQAILQVTFFVSAILLVIVPVGVCVWLWVLARQMRLVETILTSQRFQTLLHFADKRAFRIFNFGVAVDMFAYAILSVFPRDPQWAVALIAYSAMSLAVYIAREITFPITREVDALWRQNDLIVAVLRSQNDLQQYALNTLSEMHDNHMRTREHLASAFKMISATNDVILASSDTRRAIDDATFEAISATNAAIQTMAGAPGPEKETPRDK